MRVATKPLEVEADTETADHSALRLMLSYVETECLRIGATDAARHAALAASLMPESASVGVARPLVRPRNARLH
jgi:hypothetical protein